MGTIGHIGFALSRGNRLIRTTRTVRDRPSASCAVGSAAAANATFFVPGQRHFSAEISRSNCAVSAPTPTHLPTTGRQFGQTNYGPNPSFVSAKYSRAKFVRFSDIVRRCVFAVKTRNSRPRIVNYFYYRKLGPSVQKLSGK